MGSIVALGLGPKIIYYCIFVFQSIYYEKKEKEREILAPTADHPNQIKRSSKQDIDGRHQKRNIYYFLFHTNIYYFYYADFIVIFYINPYTFFAKCIK
jgi:hypothetical protein